MSGQSVERITPWVRFLLAAFALALAITQLASGATAQGTDALVLLRCEDEASMQQVIGTIRAAGGVVRHIFPTHALIGLLPEQAAAAAREQPLVELVSYDQVDPAAVNREYGQSVANVVAAWNEVFVGGVKTLAEPPIDEGAPLIGDTKLAPDAPPAGVGLPRGAPAPPGAASWQTSEYLMGNVVISLVMVESNGAIDPNTENWTTTQESTVVAKCLAAANWWVSQYPYSVASLTFTWVYNYRVPTGYEPIKHSSDDEGLWIADAMTALGYPCQHTNYDYYYKTRDYSNALRNSHNADWAYTVFVVDSDSQASQTFTDGYFAYAYLGGPLVVMTYGNNGWGISRMDNVLAHETGHIFWADDEYCDPGYACCDATAYSGYLHIQNSSCGLNLNCIMNSGGLNAPCTVTKQQLGWRDTDSNGISDILDPDPTVSLVPYSPDPTDDATPTYTGSASVTYYPNQTNPGYDVTLNRIAGVQYRVDGGAWQDCTATDGTFDQAIESYAFTSVPVSAGTHTFEVRARDSSGNWTPPPYPSDALTNSHSLTVTASADPPTVASGGNTQLSGSASDSSGHGIASWSWSDGGAGGSFSSSANVQNPQYMAPANLTDSDFVVTLTLDAACNGADPRSASGSTSLTVRPAPHNVTVTVNPPNPPIVASGGTTDLLATAIDDRGHAIASWSWTDGGAGGSFGPSPSAANPTYTAPTNTSDADLIVVLSVTATCNGSSPAGGGGATFLTAEAVAHIVTMSPVTLDPGTVYSDGAVRVSAYLTDSRAHGTTSIVWSDGGAEGVFKPSPVTTVNGAVLTYLAPANGGDTELIVTLTATGTCDGSERLSDSSSAVLTVMPVPALEEMTEVFRIGGLSNPNPGALSVNPTDGSCWVADFGNGRVVHFAANGDQLWDSGDRYYGPQSVAVDPRDGSCWVGDRDGASVHHVAVDGSPLWEGWPACCPYLAVDPADGSCWVGDYSSRSLTRLGSDGALLWTWEGFGAPLSLSASLGDGSCWIASYADGQVVRVDSSGDELARATGFLWPASVSANPADGSCWVADRGHHQVVHLDADGAELWRGGNIGVPYGTPSSVSVNATDGDGSCWVVDAYDSVAIHLAADGTELSRSGNLWQPAGVAVDPGDGSVWVVDAGNNEIVHLHPVAHSVTVDASASPSTVPSGGVVQLSASASDSQGHSIVCWSWSDGEAGGTFSPSPPDVQSPTYKAPANVGPGSLTVRLAATATCDGVNKLHGSGSAELTVLSYGADTVGLYDPAFATFRLRNTNGAGPADITFRFGSVNWSPIAGDWNGDGKESAGVYNATTGTCYLKNTNSAGAADVTFRFGPAPSTWLPIAGDWNGDSKASVGLYNPATGTFYLKNANSAGSADVTFRFGPASSTWLPIAGDWNGDGTDSVGLYNPAIGTFYLKNANSAGSADITFRFGPAASTWKPISGDWNKDGKDTIGLYNAATGTFYLRNTNTAGSADVTFRYGPAPSTWKPIAGDWDGQ